MWQTTANVFGRNEKSLLAGRGLVLCAAIAIGMVLLAGCGDAGNAQPSVAETAAATEAPNQTASVPTATPEATETPEPSAIPTMFAASSGPPPTSLPQATTTLMPTDTPVPQETAAPEPFSITILSPAPGETVANTFTIEIAVTGIELDLGPEGQLVPGAGHWHVALDTAPPPAVPHDELVAQFGPVDPGMHTITVLLNLNDADLTVVAIDQVRIMVAEQA